MKALIYVRVSSSDQVSGFSLDVQERVCRDFADRQGWTVGLVVREEGESAKTTDRRQLQSVLARLEKPHHGFTRFLVYDVTRFTRDTADYFRLKAQLAAAGVALVAVTQPTDESPTGRFMGTILAAAGQFDNDVRREKTTAGMREAIARGIWPWQAPVGYRSARGDDRRATLALDTVKAPLIRRAFERVAAGSCSLEEARAELRASGLPIPRETFSRVMHSPLYCGRIVSPRWGVEGRGAWEPIVSEETWRRAQAAMAGTPQGWRRSDTRPDFPLRWWTRCADCGKGLTGYYGKGRGGAYPYYRCPSGKHQNVARAKVHDAFEKLLDSLACPPGLWRLVEAVLTDAYDRRAKAWRTAQDAAEGRLRSLDAREERLLAGFMDGTVDGDLFRRQRARITEERSAIQVPAPILAFKPALAAGRRIVETPRLTWDSLAPGSRPAFVRLAFPERLAYRRDSGFQTPTKSLFIKQITGSQTGQRDGWYPDRGDIDTLIDGWTACLPLLAEAQGSWPTPP